MTGSTTESQIDQIVKARWLAIGISQSDLAEVLGAALKQRQEADGGSETIDTNRLAEIADALELQLDRPRTERPAGLPTRHFGSLQLMLDLRLLRAFRELEDHGTKRLLIHLAEQIVKRQANRRGDGG
jgi:hypothetical protein